MNEVRNNPLRTRQDVARAAVQLIAPLTRCLSPGKARLMLGHSGASYDEGVAGMEGFSRVLWALVPMLAGGCPEAEPLWQLWQEGLIHGTDPAHQEYWGDIGPFDQRMVEMAVMGMALCLIPERFYGALTPAQQQNLYRWLDQINRHEMPKNNWQFFRVLVNIGFRKVGLPVNEDRLRQDLDDMEGHYTADGWYFDKATQRDYYTLWAFHYYGLVYAHVMDAYDPERAARFRERARLILPRFACWFDREGRGLPYGRSLTYRFAQSSFFSACALSGVTAEGIGWGELKGLLLRNLRFWLQQPIFERDGVLTIGYGYPNLVISEGYNAPGSPYWAMKVFAVLALPPEHPFWQAEEKPYTPPPVLCDEQVRLVLTRDEENRQVVAYTAGNHAYEHMHEDEKYEKFAYSSQFTFSVVKEAGTLKKGAFDSMLVLKGDKDLWHARSGCDSFRLSEKEIAFSWSPMDGVHIESRILPVGMWHVRCHRITTDRELEGAEAAFAVPRDRAGERLCDRIATAAEADERSAVAHGELGSTGIYALRGYSRGEVIVPEANTNLMAPRTMIPTLHAALPAGTTTLVCAVYAAAGDELPHTIPEEVLNIAQSC
ncbi:MAG: DUF2264 domain-containing protein [Clostridiales bacterium]|nr:DUF2264 domain-containing protein [Clostridiales bacterium]